MRFGRLELRIEVNGTVDRIGEPVQAFPSLLVPAIGDDPQLVRGGEVHKGDTAVAEC